jgi:hypothetical protein
MWHSYKTPAVTPTFDLSPRHRHDKLIDWLVNLIGEPKLARYQFFIRMDKAGYGFDSFGQGICRVRSDFAVYSLVQCLPKRREPLIGFPPHTALVIALPLQFPAA